MGACGGFNTVLNAGAEGTTEAQCRNNLINITYQIIRSILKPS
jgi:hypothetical protein